jgi:hypothetical protein
MPSKSPKQARMMAACENCGKERWYSARDAERGRITKLCQPCSVAAYNATRPPARSHDEKLVYLRRWFQENKRRQSLYYLDYRERVRLEMVAAYGGKCGQCGERDPIVLVLDHIADDAKIDREENRHKGGYKMYLFLKRNGWPKGRHRLLCQNCNFRKEYDRRKNAVRFSQAS